MLIEQSEPNAKMAASGMQIGKISDGRVTMSDIVVALGEEKRWFLGIWVAGSVAALAVVLALPRMYSASTVLMPPQQQSGSSAALAQFGVRPRIEQVLREQGKSTEQVIEITSIAILKSALLADMGATILPVSPLLPEILRGEMVAVPVSDAKLSRTVSLCSSKNIPLTNAARAVAKRVQEVTRQLVSSGDWPDVKLLT